MKTWLTLLAIVALAAVIGAVVGLLTSDMLPEGAVAGAVIGLILGSWLAMRVHAHRSAMRNARQDPQEAARHDRLQEKHLQTKELVGRHPSREFDDLSALH